MNGMKENNRIRRYVVPVLAATAIMVLVFLTVPMTGIPASVRGAYGGGIGGGTPPAAPPATPTIGTVGFTVPNPIVMGTAGTTTVVFSGPDAANIDPASLTFAGATVVSWSYDASGNLVLVFDKANLNLKPGDTTAMVSGKLKNGTPFSGAVLVTVQ
jgi:hypothetical protein